MLTMIQYTQVLYSSESFSQGRTSLHSSLFWVNYSISTRPADGVIADCENMNFIISLLWPVKVDIDGSASCVEISEKRLIRAEKRST